MVATKGARIKCPVMSSASKRVFCLRDGCAWWVAYPSHAGNCAVKDVCLTAMEILGYKEVQQGDAK